MACLRPIAWTLACALPVGAALAVPVAGQDAPPAGPPASATLEAPAGQDGQQPVFRGGATLISVDAYPRRDGRIVEGLSAGDFEVFEDGRPQRIEAFEFVHFEPGTEGVTLPEPRSKAEADRLAADPRTRLFIVFLDLDHITPDGALRARDPLFEFLRWTVGPSDLSAVVTLDTQVEDIFFGRSAGALLTELSRLWTSGRMMDTISGTRMPVNPAEERLVACAGSLDVLAAHRRDQLYTTLENLVVRLGALREERTHLLFITGGEPMRGSLMTPGAPFARGQPSGAADAGAGVRAQLGRLPQQGGAPDVVQPSESAVCRAVLRRLRGIDYDRRLRDLERDTVRANITFHMLDLTPLQAGAGAAARAEGQAFAWRVLADATDGVAVRYSNDVSRGLERILNEVSGYYLLGYRPSSETADGRFREIEVRVRQPGVDVSARRGYYALTPTMARAAVSPSRGPRMPTPVEIELSRLARLRDTDALLTHASVSNGALVVVGEIAAREIAQGRWREGGDLDVTVTGRDGVARTASGRIEPGARGLALSMPLDLGAIGPVSVGVRLAGDRTLQDRFEVAVPAAAILGPPRYFRARTLPRAPIEPAADLRFTWRERLIVEWPVDTGIDRTDVRLLNGRGEPLPRPLTAIARDRDGHPVLAVDFGIAPLAAGDYLLEASAASGEEETRVLAAFRVVQ
jgi:VWFA-related protein